ncbi:unnamed protein product, partial [marine sediment metagenome]
RGQKMEKTISGKDLTQDFDASNMSKTDKKLMQIVESYKKRIRVIGVGGSGCNTLTRLSYLNIDESELIGMNTDVQSLLTTVADRKIILGPQACKGLGTGSNVSLGEDSVRESMDNIISVLEGSSIVFMTSGLGGGTGSGSVPIIAETARSMRVVSVACVTLPFNSEGLQRWRNAEYALKKLQTIADTVIVIPNDKLLELAPNRSMNDAFQMADNLLGDALGGMIDLVTKPGLVNRDIADLRSILKDAGVAVMGVGESKNPDEEERMIEAAEFAMRSPLLDADVSTADRVLINIAGNKDMKLDGVNTAIEYVMDRVQPGADLFWGVQIDNSLDQGTTKLMVITGGVKSLGDLPLIEKIRRASTLREKGKSFITDVAEGSVGFSYY